MLMALVAPVDGNTGQTSGLFELPGQAQLAKRDPLDVVYLVGF